MVMVMPVLVGMIMVIMIMVVWDGPLSVPKDADDTAIQALVQDWSARLSAATRRAEMLVGRTAH